MSSSFRLIALTVFLIGLFSIGLVGTSTSMTFVWPVYLLLGVAGLLAIGTVFSPVGFAIGKGTTLTLLTFALYLLIRASDSPVNYFAREDVGLVVACLIAYISFLCLCPTGSRRMAVVFVLASLVGVNLVLALLQHFVAPGLWLLPGYERTASTGIGGLFNQPDHFATFLAALLPLWLALLVFARNSRPLRALWITLALASGGTVLLMGSLSGLLVAFAGLGCFSLLLAFVVWKRLKPAVRKVGGVAFSILSIMTLAILWAAAAPIGRELGSGTLAEDGKANLPHVWEAGFKQFTESPLLGTGSRSSYIYSRTFRSPELGAQVGEPEFVHNEFLQMLADYGLIGLALLSLVLFSHLRAGMKFLSAYQSVKGNPGTLLPHSQHLALAVGMLSILAAIGVSALFDFSLHLPVFAILSTVALACLSAPDPMAQVLSKRKETSFVPGGGLLFSLRGIGFGCGLAMLVFGVVFSRSEFHYEMARLAFEGDRRNFQQFRHLQTARSLDPQNPYIFSLSAHAQVAGITPEMAAPARTQALERANQYFSIAQQIYPQDIFAAIGHAAVLDELGMIEGAKKRLDDARDWAPLYGNLMLAEAEHYLRRGDVNQAESAYQKSLAAHAFRNPLAAEEGLRTISEWKMIAQQEGIRWEQPESGYPESAPNSRIKQIKDASVLELDLAGEAPPSDTIPKPVAWNEDDKPSNQSE